jgi:hypothetical protein
MRAIVAAIAASPAPLTPADLRLASVLTSSLQHRLPEQPWGEAAACDIARRLGDAAAYRECQRELARIAPGHYETLRAFALPIRTPVLPWFGWSGLAGAVIATLVHAARHRLRGAAATAVTVVLTAIPAPGNARAADGEAAPAETAEVDPTQGFAQKWPVSPTNPLQSLPTEEQRQKDPLEYGYHLMDLTEAGDRAARRGDYQKALPFYQALAKAVPDVSRPFFMLCETYERLADRENALKSCTLGLTKTGVRVIDYRTYSRVVLARSERLKPDEIADLTQVAGHLRGQADDSAKELAISIQCQIGLRANEVKALEECVSALNKKAPNDSHTLTYAFALALAKKDLKEADQLLQRARKTSMAPAGIQKMEQAVTAARPFWKKFIANRNTWLGSVGLLGVIAAAVLFVRRRSVARRPA